MDHSIQGDDGTTFEPVLNAKVDELFLRWISMPQQSYLFEQLRKAPFSLGSAKRIEIKQTPSATPENTSLSDGLHDKTKPLLSPRRTTSKDTRLNVTSFHQNHEKPKHLKTKLDLKKLESSKNKLAATVSQIPQFYFPHGKPLYKSKLHEVKRNVTEVFDSLGETNIGLSQMGAICKACGCPMYWKSCLFMKSKQPDSSTVTKDNIIVTWKRIVSNHHDDASRFLNILSKDNAAHLEFDDFLPLLRDIVDTHPGLSFLKEAPEFHTRYMNTVIARIFYTVNRSWSGRITVNELRRSNFLSILQSLEEEQDINSVTDYFSYEHFYVIYCKFWELDTDHDLFIDSSDLARHGDGVLSSRLISRLMSQAVQRSSSGTYKEGSMSYIDFVWFLVAEEDKTTKTSIEYWFRCMDLDGDGYISLYEMEYFYEEQIRKLELLDIEPLPFMDCVCAMLDMIRPVKPDCVSLGDLKRCGLAYIFFDTFLNVEKYLEHEQKDPFSNPLPEEFSEQEKQTDWEKYAAVEYELLVAEEQANEADALANMLDEVCQIQGSNFRLGSNETSW